MSVVKKIASFMLPPGVGVERTWQTIGMPSDLNESRDPYNIGTALRCMSIIASAVAGCPLRAVDKDSSPVDVPGMVYMPEQRTPFEVVETVTLHLAGWGNAYVRKQRDADGEIFGLAPIHPSTVTVDYDADALRSGLPIDKRFRLATGEELTSEDIMHIAGPSDDGVVGLSVVEKAARVFSAARENDKTSERLGRQGLRIPGYLSTDTKIDGDQAEKVQKRWAERTAGSTNAGKVPVIGSGMKYHPVDISPADAQFLEQRRYSVTEIARLYGIPGWMVNDQEKSTSWGTGQQQQFISFITLTLKPYMQRIERRITAELLDYATAKAEFKVEGLLRGDSAQRAAFYASGIQHGWLVPNDIRPLEDLALVGWGDAPYLPYNQSANAQTEGITDDGTDE